MTTRKISASALAREAGVQRNTASAWLRGTRRTHPANEQALEAAFLRLGGDVFKQGGEAGVWRAVLKLGGPCRGVRA